jgi:hypothetical protein
LKLNRLFKENLLMRIFPRLVVAALFCVLASAPAWTQELECSPCSHNFGKVAVGDSGSYSIQLTNTGDKKVTIESKSKRGAAFSFGDFPLPLKIDPGASVQLPINFKPIAKGKTDGSFELVSTARDERLTMDVSGVGESGENPQLGISPASLNFGNVTVGSSATLTATLTASNAAVTISADRSTSSEFSILKLQLPATIPAGQSLAVTIQFTPTSSGTDSAKAGFISNAKDSPTMEPVTGTGVAQDAHSVSLSWNAVETAVGYNVYRGNAKAGPFQEINSSLDASTNYTDYTVVNGDTYYYVTTAVNAQGGESSYSNVATAVIPNQ